MNKRTPSRSLGLPGITQLLVPGVSRLYWHLMLVLMFAIGHTCLAQSTMTITGKLLDQETGEPVAFGLVGISGSSAGGVTAEDGLFTIKDLPIRPYKLIISHVAYTRVILDITPERAKQNLVIRLKPSTTELEAVSVTTRKGMRKRRRSLERFKRIFFGANYQQKYITIVNQEVLDFDDKLSKTISSKQPLYLKIANRHLGYMVEYFDLSFKFDESRNWFKGHPRFTELEAENAEEAQKWVENRKKAYQGSIRHLFLSTVNNNLEDEGFLVNLTNQNPGEHQPSRFIKETEPAFVGAEGEKGTNITVTFNEERGYYEVKFNRIKLIESFFVSMYEDSPHSFIELEAESIRVYDTGVLVDPLDLTTFGEYAKKGVYQMLPFNYNPNE